MTLLQWLGLRSTCCNARIYEYIKSPDDWRYCSACDARL